MPDARQHKLSKLWKRFLSRPLSMLLFTAIVIMTVLLFQISEFSHSIAPTMAGIFLMLAIIAFAVFLVLSMRDKPKIRHDESGEGFIEETSIKPNRLTRLVKRYLDVIWYIFLGLAIVMPFFAAVVSIDYFDGGAGRWGVDLLGFWGFTIDLEQITDMAANTKGLRNGVITGKAMLSVETFSVYAWYLFVAINEVMLLIALYIFRQLRGIFATLVKGLYFTLENSRRIKKVGFAVLFANIVIPMMHYFGGRAMLEDIVVNVPGIELYPAVINSGDGIFLGILIIILAGVAREAADVYQEQLGTI